MRQSNLEIATSNTSCNEALLMSFAHGPLRPEFRFPNGLCISSFVSKFFSEIKLKSVKLVAIVEQNQEQRSDKAVVAVTLPVHDPVVKQHSACRD